MKTLCVYSLLFRGIRVGVAALMFTVICAAGAAAIDESILGELRVLVDARQYDAALAKVNSLLGENAEDPDLLLIYAKIKADPERYSFFNPKESLDTYEKVYLLKKNGGAAEEELATLRDEVEAAWMRAILDAMIDIEEDPVADYGRFAGGIVPVMLHFDAEWCPPCRKMLADVKSFDIRYLDKVLVIREDISDETKTLEEKYEIKAIPYSIFIDRKGNEIRNMGMMDRRKLFAAYYVITDFFYEEKMLTGENIMDYWNRIYKYLEPLTEEAIDDVIAGTRDPFEFMYDGKPVPIREVPASDPGEQ